MKKILKISGIVLGVIIILLLLAPFLFKGSLERLLKENINKNLNATVTWEELDLSLFSSFPDAALEVKNFSVVNKVPFAGDTLAAGDLAKIDMGIMQLFKSGNEPIIVDALQFDNALVNIKVDSLGNANYDIAVKSDAPITDETESNDGFTFDLEHYEINNSTINYLDEATQTFLTLKEMNHEGTGDFSLDVSELETQTNALVTLKIEDIEYLSDNAIALNANFEMDLPNQKYTFLENEATINQLPLTFDGFVQVKEDASEMDLTFKTPSSDFKNFLAVIPETYVKQIENVTTTGNFTVNGMLKGVVDDTQIPQMDISVNSTNASFKYPDLPKAVQNITIDAQLKNETGLVEDTFLRIGNATFSIDGEPFAVSGLIKNLTENALVDLSIKGSLNLANIEQVLPVEIEQNLSGTLRADITTNFDMASIENEQYQNIKSNGTASISNFNYKGAFKNDLKIGNADIVLSPGDIQLKRLNAATGQTDISATGKIQNLIPFLMSKQGLKGNFNVQSNTFNINDFMASEEISENDTSENERSRAPAQTDAEEIKIPDFLDASLTFSANKVLYDNLELTNVKGTATVANETATLSNVTSNILGGSVALGGNVSTKNTTPTFEMSVDLSKIDIAESFQKMELLQFLTPIARALDGDLNTKLELSGNLTKDLTPQLTSLAGDALAEIITAEVDNSKTPLLAALGQKIPFLDWSRLSLRDIDTKLTFNNGNINVQPFDFNVKGINVSVDGRHGLDKTINYNVTLDVPGRYLGSSVSGLLAKLDPADAQNVTVALPVGISGTINDPKVSVNMQTAVNELTQRLIEKQKQELKDKGTNILEDLISGGNKPKDSASTNQNTNTQQNTSQIVRDVLGGLFGGRKKDSVN